MKRTCARNVDGLIIFTGLELELSDHESQSNQETNTNHTAIAAAAAAMELTPSQQSSKNVPSVALSFVESRSASPETSNDGPNSNGTYSRAYTLQHPEITWLHRGQGRYRPEASLSESSQTTPTLSQEQDLLLPTNLHRSLRSRKSSALDDALLETRSEPRHLSPRSTRLSDTSYSLRRRQSDQTTHVEESREARLLRRANSSTTSAGSQSIDAIEEGSTSSKTYVKSYVEAHPEMQFRHCGNGFYRRLSTTQHHLDASSGHRNSSRSFAKSEASQLDTIPQTVHSSELKNYPGDKFRHCGNGYYRRESVTSQHPARSTTTVTDRSVSPLHTFTKEQMQEYKDRHHGIVFVHRGNGRYKIAAHLGIMSEWHAQIRAFFETPLLEDTAQYNTSQKHERNTASNDNERDAASGLVTKRYVDDHPELTFHHRGQGRWARGARPMVGNSDRSPVEDEPKLVDRSYVDAHPHETFHHRGQGRWAKGLPPPGSSNKMAIRGPGAPEHREMTTSALSESNIVNLNNTDMPGLYELVRKEQGPAAWPQIEWHYRGGGKWSRSSKDEADALQRAAHAGRRSTTQISDSQPRPTSTAAGARRESLPVLKRKHSAIQTTESIDIDQQSKGSPPRPRMLTLDEDILNDDDLPELFAEDWSPLGPEDEDDEAGKILRQSFRPLNEPDALIKSMTKLDLSIRPMENLYRIAAHVQHTLQQMQDEYLELDKIAAPHARIPRKVATGGRLPVDPLVFEDKKEADLYDYQFDSKRIGCQDPEAQRISRDVDGRGLRKRRKRGEADAENHLLEAPLPRRVIKPVEKFEGMPGLTRRSRLVDASERGSATPDRVMTPEKVKTTPELHACVAHYVVPKSGRWANHIPKRIRELRGGSSGPGGPDLADDAGMSADEDESSAASTKTTPTKAPDIINSIEDQIEIDTHIPMAVAF